MREVSKNNDLKKKWKKLYTNAGLFLSHNSRYSDRNVKKVAANRVRQSNNVTIDALPCEACTGCSACANVCPEGAISMKQNSEGYYRPVIDKEKCVQCGLCQNICPELHPVSSHSLSGEYYVVQGSDESHRMCDDNDIVYLMARNVIEEEGYFCGMNPNGEKISRMSLCSDAEKVQGWCKERLMQPRVEDRYQEIKRLLDDENQVLFYGIPCQTAGLKSYLGKDYHNLIIVDKWCEGVASPKTFEKHCEEIVGGVPQWAVYNTPSCFGVTGKGMYMKRRDGSEYIGSVDHDVYVNSVYSGLNAMASCKECHYAKLSRQGDVTVFDYSYNMWRYPDASENEKLYLVKINTKKGQAYFEQIRPELRFCKKISGWNVNLDSKFNQLPTVHPERQRFFELLQTNPYSKALEYSKNKKYDVAVLGLWYGRNYGSMLTYYALHSVLKSMNLSVLMVSNPLMNAYKEEYSKTDPLAFGLRYYDVSPIVPLEQLERLNDSADTFMLGSDQLWNYWLSNPYGQMYYLDFVRDNKKKIAYGTSFGTHQYNGTEFQRTYVEQNLKRFDAISVREEYAVNICRETFGVKAKKVLDPVLLCDREEYDFLIEQIGEIEQKDYILAYILDPTYEIGQMLKEVARQYNKKVYVILDEPPLKFEQNVVKLALNGVKPDENKVYDKDGTLTPEEKKHIVYQSDGVEIIREVEVREWLAYFKYASGVITDSFHGTCFSIIFEKQFATLLNKRRGFARFSDLLSHYELENRIVEFPEQIIDNPDLKQDIQYDKVYHIIEHDKTESMEWLSSAIYADKTYQMNSVYSTHGEVKKDEGE